MPICILPFIHLGIFSGLQCRQSLPVCYAKVLGPFCCTSQNSEHLGHRFFRWPSPEGLFFHAAVGKCPQAIQILWAFSWVISFKKSCFSVFSLPELLGFSMDTSQTKVIHPENKFFLLDSTPEIWGQRDSQWVFCLMVTSFKTVWFKTSPNTTSCQPGVSMLLLPTYSCSCSVKQGIP